MKFLCLLMILSLIGCKQGESRSNATSSQPGWNSDESQFFSVNFPPEYSASTFNMNMGNESKTFPGLQLQSKSGSFVVVHDSTYAGMLLRDGVAAGLQLLQDRGGKLLVPSHNIASKNGSCIGFVISDPARDCPKDVKAKECFPIGYVAHCETPFGKRFLGMGILAEQASNARLEPGAIEMAKTFDRIMATLEFKKF